jgi:hypothetical protein
VAEQQSPASVLPSSHCSPTSMTLLPQVRKSMVTDGVPLVSMATDEENASSVTTLDPPPPPAAPTLPLALPPAPPPP